MKRLYFVLIFCSLMTFLAGCRHNPGACFSDEKMSINLRWVSSYPNEKEEDVRTGLAWGMSMLGAEMPKSCMEKGFIPLDNKCYKLNLNALGFSETAKKAFLPILTKLKESEEYAQKGGIDIGRFLVLTLHSSWSYYAITNVPKNLADFRTLYAFDKTDTFPVISSSVALGNRLVLIAAAEKVEEMAFIAAEGTGEWVNGTFQSTDFEAFDIMKNGQLRFGVYDKKGGLITASPLFLGAAGKPGKCMWCHERNVLPVFTNTPEVADYMSLADFQAKIKKKNEKLHLFQSALTTEIDWNNGKAHTLQEWLYIGFMEPNLYRIAADWGMSESEVLQKIGHLPTHPHEEFAFFGDCYDRQGIDEIAPFHSLRVPESVREPANYEPHFKKR